MVFKLLTAGALIAIAASAEARPTFDPIIDNQMMPPTIIVEPSVAAVPEPATWMMMIGGFGLVGVMRRRNRSVAA